MAWTAPMTATSNATFTAAQFNTHVRDNLMETAPAKAANAGGYFVSTGANAIVERQANGQSIASPSDTTVSTSYGALAGSSGPAATVTTGTSAIVWFGAWHFSSSSAATSAISVAVSGATSVASSDNWALFWINHTAADVWSFTRQHVFTGLTAGSNTFTMQYKTSTGTATFQRRELIVLPL